MDEGRAGPYEGRLLLRSDADERDGPGGPRALKSWMTGTLSPLRLGLASTASLLSGRPCRLMCMSPLSPLVMAQRMAAPTFSSSSDEEVGVEVGIAGGGKLHLHVAAGDGLIAVHPLSG